MLKKLDSEQAQGFVGLNLGPNCKCYQQTTRVKIELKLGIEHN